MHKQDPAIRFERLNETNCNDLPVLYHAVYERKLAADWFIKKYAPVYQNVGYVGYIAYGPVHKPIAFIGAVPCELSYNGKEVLAAQLTDGMTHPDWRSKGLFVELVKRITQLCIQYRIGFLFGFPNQHSLPVFRNRLAWDVYGSMDLFTVPVRALPLEKIARRLPVLKNIYDRYMNSVLEKCRASPVGIQYPGTYIISILHANIRIKINNGMAIGEMSVSKNEFQEVMHTLKSIARRLGVAKISFHCSTGSELHRLFAENYPSIPSFTVIAKDLGCGIPVDTLKFSYGDIDIF